MISDTNIIKKKTRSIEAYLKIPMLVGVWWEREESVFVDGEMETDRVAPSDAGARAAHEMKRRFYPFDVNFTPPSFTVYSHPS